MNRHSTMAEAVHAAQGDRPALQLIGLSEVDRVPEGLTEGEIWVEARALSAWDRDAYVLSTHEGVTDRFRLEPDSPAPFADLADPTLVGRGPLLKSLVERIEEHPIVAIYGGEGVGKSAVMRAAAALLSIPSRSRPIVIDGRDLRGTSLLEGLYRLVTGGVASPGIPEVGLAAELRRLNPPVLVLDQMDEVSDGLGEVVRMIQQRLPQLKVMLGCRARIGVSGVLPIRVPTLELPAQDASEAELLANPAVALFMKFAPTVERTAGNYDLAASICREVDGVPGAIKTLLLAHHPADLVGLLDELVNARRLGLLHAVDRATTIALRTVSKEALGFARYFCTTSVELSNDDLTELGALAHLEPHQVEDRIAQLDRADLLQGTPETGYRLSRSARALLLADSTVDWPVERAIFDDWCEAKIVRVGKKVLETGPGPEFPWLHRHLGPGLDYLRERVRRGHREQAAELVGALLPLFFVGRYYGEGKLAMTSVLDMAGDLEPRAHALLAGRACFLAAQMSDIKWGRRAGALGLRTARRLKDRLAVARVEGSIAEIYRCQGQFRKAARISWRSLHVFEEEGDLGRATILACGLMAMEFDAGNLEGAARAYAFAREHHDPESLHHRFQIAVNAPYHLLALGTRRARLEAIEHVRTAVEGISRLRELSQTVGVGLLMATVCLELDRHVAAENCLGAVLGLCESEGIILADVDQRDVRRLMERLHWLGETSLYSIDECVDVLESSARTLF